MNINQLADYIERTPELLALAGQPDQLLAALTAKTIERTDRTLKTNLTIINTFPIQQAAAIIGAFKAAAGANPLYDSVYVTLCSTGIDFSNPLTQGQIDALTAAGAWAVNVGDALKALGIWHVSPASVALGSDPTAEDVTAAAAQVTARQQQQSLIRLAAGRYNEAVSGITAGTLTSWEEIRAFLGGA